MMFLVQGQWVDGATLNGWAPREQPSMEICLDRAREAMTVIPPKGAEWLQASCQVVAADRPACTNPVPVGMQLAAGAASN